MMSISEIIIASLEKLRKKKPLTAEEAWNLTRFNKQISSIDSVVKEKIDYIEEYIKFKSEDKSESSIIITRPEYQDDVFQKVEEHFINQGFKVYKDRILKDFGDKNEYIIISWNIPSEKV